LLFKNFVSVRSFSSTGDVFDVLGVVRPRRMHEMRTIAIDDPESLSVCPSHDFAAQKRLNGSRSYLGWKLSGPKKIELDGSLSPVNSMRPSPNYFGHLVFIQMSMSTWLLLRRLFAVRPVLRRSVSQRWHLYQTKLICPQLCMRIGLLRESVRGVQSLYGTTAVDTVVSKRRNVPQHDRRQFYMLLCYRVTEHFLENRISNCAVQNHSVA